MLYETDEMLHIDMRHHEWIWVSNGGKVPEGMPLLGDIASIEYTDGTVIRVLLPKDAYVNARGYVESTWAKGGILRLKDNIYCDEFGDGSSLPTQGIRKIKWGRMYGTVKPEG